ELALPARQGWRRAAELVLPDAAVLQLLDPAAIGSDGPLDVLDDGFATEFARSTMTAVGVLDRFEVVTDEDPAEPDHGLPDEDEWWHSRKQPPDRLLAVRDLDLVADDAWPAALQLLAGDPDMWRALVEPGGHTGWWVARNALLAGAAPLDWRLPGATSLAGLYDPLPDVGLDERTATAAGVRVQLTVEDVADAVDLLDRLGQRSRDVPPATATRAHEALGSAALDVAQLPVPERVRTLAGTVGAAGDCVVLDAPWFLEVWPAARLVPVAAWSAAEALAELLDLPLA